MSFLEEDIPTTSNVSTPKVNSLWVEAFRPATLEEYIGNDTLKRKVKQWISENDIPHLLFYGPAGTGKTSLAKLITKSIKCDVMYINASDENGIETVRVKIKNFASTVGFNAKKVIILDEADALTPEGQRALRNTMETFSMHSRFILTCNYHERIIEPIVSRCQPFEVIPPTKKDVAVRLIEILNKEGIKYDREGVISLITAHYPDIRSIINTAQRNVHNGELKLSDEVVITGDTKTKLIEFMISSNQKEAFTNIRQMVADNGLRNFTDLYSTLYEKIDSYARGNDGMVIIAIAESQFQDVSVVDKEICFMACIAKIFQLIK